MSINQFTFRGMRSFDDLGLIITEPPKAVYPGRSIEITSVPGRNGDVLTDHGCFENVTVEYSVAYVNKKHPGDMERSLGDIALCLLKDADYGILSDTYSNEYFRYAVYSGGISFTNLVQKLGTAVLRFNCKPFKYRKDGGFVVEIKNGVLYGPEDLPSSPYIKITGSGDITLYVNDSAFFLEDVDGYIELDSDLMAAFKGTELQNNKIAFYEFPELIPGKNTVTCTGNVSKIEIVPRWRKL